MPREIWSIQLEVSLAKALTQLGTLEKRLAKIETKFRMMGASTSPAAAKNMAALNAQTKAAGNSATVAQTKFMMFATTMKGGFSNFLGIVAKRLAFTAAAILETFTFLFVLAIPAAFAMAVKAGAAFEDAMLRTATVAAAGLVGMEDNYAVLGTAARDFAVSVAFSATEVADAMFEMVSSGISTLETVKAMPAVMNFAGAAMTDLTTSVDIMTQVMKSFNLEASDLDDVADVLIGALNSTTLNVDRLKAAFRFAAPAGGAFGQTLEDTVIVMSLFVDATKQGGIAGRAFRFALAALANPTRKGEDVLRKLTNATTGARMEMQDFALTQADGKPQSIITVLRKLADTTVTSSQVLEVFGNRSGPVVALAIRRIRDSLNTGADGVNTFRDKFAELEDKISKAKGADQARIQYERFLSSTSSQFRLLGAVGEEALLKIFDAIQPLLASIIKFAQAVLLNANNVAKFAGLAGDLATLLLFLGGVVLLKLTLALYASAAGFVAMGTGAGFAFGAVMTLIGAWKLLKMVTPAAILFLLVNIFQDLQRETNALGKVMEGLGRLFGASTRDAAEMGESWSFVGVITDALRIGLAALGIAFFTMARAVVWSQKAIVSLLPGTSELVAGMEKQIETLDAMVESYADEAAAVAESFGVRQGRIEQEAEFTRQAQLRLEAEAAKAGMTGITAEAIAALSEAEQELLGTLVERAEKEHDVTTELREGEEWRLKAIVQNEELDEILREQAASLLETIQANKDLAQAQKDAEAHTKAVAAALNRFVPEQKKATEGVKAMLLSLEGMNKLGMTPNIDLLFAMTEELALYDKQVKDGTIKANSELTTEMEAVRRELLKYTGGVQLVTATTETWTDAAEGLPGPLGTLKDQLARFFETKTTEEFNDALANLERGLATLRREGGLNVELFRALKVMTFELAEEFYSAGDQSDEMKERLMNLTTELGIAFPRSAEEAARLLEEFGETGEEETEKVETAFDKMFGEIQSGMARALGDMLFEAKSFGEFIEDLFKGISKMLVADAFGSILGAVTDAFSEAAGTVDESGEMIAEGFGGALSNIGDLFTEFKGDTIGLMIGIGVAVFGILKGLFGSDGELKNVFLDMKRLVGDISEELGEKIRETARELGRTAAEAEHMGEIMEEVGVTVDNFAGFVEIARGSLHALNRGQIDAATAASQLNDNFALLTKEMENLGIVGSKDVILLMNQIRDSGLEVASVIKFIDDNMRLAASGLETVVAGALINTEDELGRLGRVAFAVFSEMIANGSSFIEAMDAIGPSLDGMIEKMKENGLEGDKTFKTLMKWRRLIENNREIVEAFDGLNSIMVGLANTGMLNQEVFDDLLLQAGKLALDLTNAGVKGKDAFILMAPFLDDLIEQARKHGLEIDDATQKLIDQAEEYGVLGKGAESETDIMREGFDLITRAINRLITTMGGIPIEVDRVGRSFDDLRDGAERSFEDIATQGRRYFDDLADAGEEAAERLNRGFDDVEENLVGNTVFRNIQEKGGAFLEKLGAQGNAVADRMDFSSAEGSIPGVGGANGSNFITVTPQPQLSEGSRGMSKFEKQNLAILGKLVDAVIVSGKSGGSGGNGATSLTGLRQTIGDMMRDASIDGDVEVHADSVALLN